MTHLVVHLNDYRLDDHRPLDAALRSGQITYGLAVIDPAWSALGPYGWPRMGERRLNWRLEAIEQLRQAYRDRGGDLVVRVGRTAQEVAAVADALGCIAIFGQRPKTAEERAVVAAIEAHTPALTHTWLTNDTLFDAGDLPFDRHSYPKSFTRVRKYIEKYLDVPAPIDAPTTLWVPPCDVGPMPTMSDLHRAQHPIDARSTIARLGGGERGAQAQIEAYVWENEHLGHYKKTRNGMTAWHESSRFSLYLATGCISPRRLVHVVRQFEAERYANESTYWLYFELLWREYFHHLAEHAGDAIFREAGVQNRQKTWQPINRDFDRWILGLTGQPLVDACMRELALTGYMSNRGRQIVASHLTKGLGIDWRAGAYWFEHHLIDYDPCVNWGNWQYVSGVGTDPRDRQFNVRKQAQNYDRSAAFVHRWCPELAGLTAEECIAMNTPPADPWAQGQLDALFQATYRKGKKTRPTRPTRSR
ncbi:MAG: DASH family cryptochrome [Myxococcota bacterium]|nr:DASH family cryptochrome [Myxococcota bacterium]